MLIFIKNIMNKRISINDMELMPLTVKKVKKINVKIKVLLDEEAQHFVKDVGALESSIIGPIESPYYKTNIEKLSEV